jgi:hypothetical protein
VRLCVEHDLKIKITLDGDVKNINFFNSMPLVYAGLFHVVKSAKKLFQKGYSDLSSYAMSLMKDLV